MSSNLPPNTTQTDSSTPVRTFFDNYFNVPTSFPADQVDAVVGFFQKRGFDTISSNSTAVVILQQARTDNVDVFTLIDTLKGLTDVQLSAVVTEILNISRQRISALGYRQDDNGDYLEKRNILV